MRPSTVWVGPTGSCPAMPVDAGKILHLPVADGVHEQLSPIVEAVVAQMLAGHLAAQGGVNGDSFRMDRDTDDAERFLKAHLEYISRL